MSTVEIRFTGLFLFAQRDDIIWVLMPESTKHPHTPCLYQPSGPEKVKLEEPDIDFSGTIKAAGNGAIPSMALPVDEFTGEDLKPRLLERRYPKADLTGRLKLAQPSFVAPGDTALWKVGNVNRYLTNELKFLYNGHRDDRVVIEVKEGKFTYRADADGWIRIHFTHEPKAENPCRGGKPSAHHVEAYYKLMERGGAAGPTPKLLQACPARLQLLDAIEGMDTGISRSKGRAARNAMFDELLVSLSTFTCLVGSG